MKYLVLLCSLFVGNLLHSQDTLHIPAKELEGFFIALDSLRSQDSLKTTLIETYEEIIHTDSLVLAEKDYEVEQLNLKLELYEERLSAVDKWYRTPWFGVGAGALGTILIVRAVN
jgi:hypothetical protein